MFFWLLILGILLFEITFQITPILGYLLYVLFILTIIWIYSKANSEKEDYKLLILLTILPLLRISFSFIDVTYFIKTIIFYVFFVSLTAFYLFKFDLPVRAHRTNLKVILFVTALGLVLGYLISKIANIGNEINLIYLLPFIAISEEVFFRSMIQKTVKDLYSVSTSIFSSALLYFIFSLSLGYIAIFLFLTSIISAWIYEKKENIYLNIIFNFCLHLLIFVI